MKPIVGVLIGAVTVLTLVLALPRLLNETPIRAARPAPAAQSGRCTDTGASRSSSPALVTAGSPSKNGFSTGLVAGADPLCALPVLQRLGAGTARLEFRIGVPASTLSPIVDAYARAGIRLLLLAGFDGRLPTASESQNLGSWAAAFGRGGTFWRGRGYPPSIAVADIEFGNETSYSYQFRDNSDAAYASRAQTYARRFKDAQAAIREASPRVGLLAIGDPSGFGAKWVHNMFTAVPTLGQLVAGWTVHPYGPSWQARIDNVISSTHAEGAPDTIPIFITEWGLASDGGRCLDDNYGWDRCMSYGGAANTLTTTIAAMRARYATRLSAFYLFQAEDQRPSGATASREGYFGALRSNQAPKGAYTAAVRTLFTNNH